jgi:hypothetical protein
MVGSSIALGALVPREDSFAALLPAELSRRTGRKVEVYNESFTFETPHVISLRFNEALAAQPDMILWTLSAWDVENASLVLPPKTPETPPGIRARLASLMGMAKNSRAGKLLTMLLYKSPNSYVKRYLIGGASSGFLQANLSADWQAKLRETDAYAAEIEGQAKDAGVPVVAGMLPLRTQATMILISEGEWPAGFDPYKLDKELRTIVEKHGGTYIEILPDYRHFPNPEQEYFLMDGHPNIRGHATMSRFLAEALTGGAVPALKAIASPQSASGQVK